MRAFEIHTFQSGKWKIDSVFDDRELAVFEAQRMESSKRYIGVRVIEETFDEATQHTATRTIYKGTMLEQSPMPEAVRKAASGGKGAKAGPRGGAQPTARRSGKAPAAAKSKSSTGLLVAVLSVIVLVGIGAVVALRVISGQM